MYDDVVLEQNIPLLSTPTLKLFKHFSISMGGNLQEVWTFNTVKYNDYTEEAGVVATTYLRFASTISVPVLEHQFTVPLILKKGRAPHHLDRLLGHGIQPKFQQVTMTPTSSTLQVKLPTYTLWTGFIWTSHQYSNSLGITINNSQEAKVRDKDTTKTEKKINSSSIT